MTIAEISEKYGLTKDTLRYYEKEGIIPPVPRNKNGFRAYDQESVEWVEFACCMRNAGVSIQALARYVALIGKGDDTVRERRDILLAERENLEQRLQSIQEMKAKLDKKIEMYEAQCGKLPHSNGTAQ